MLWDEYMALFVTVAIVYQWKQATKAVMLREDAEAVLQTIPWQDRQNYEKFVN